MGDSLFDIFGDQLTNTVVKSVTRLPLYNSENFGKTVSAGPTKRNEPLKPLKKATETKKSFLSNVGTALQNTPARKVFSPKTVNLGPVIYSDADNKEDNVNTEDLEFTKPKHVIDNFQFDALDFFLPLKTEGPMKEDIPSSTPPPSPINHYLDFNCSYSDEFFTDDFSIDSFPDDEDLNLPNIY